jgi:hypothetical protein
MPASLAQVNAVTRVFANKASQSRRLLFLLSQAPYKAIILIFFSKKLGKLQNPEIRHTSCDRKAPAWETDISSNRDKNR